ncbi:MAG: hypothetical protein AB7P03_05965 [Kofleriaceae bacterium]
MQDAAPIPQVMRDGTFVDISEITTVSERDQPDLCTLAAALPEDDLCSLICDPVALADQMLADGMDRGACYQLRCAFAADTVLVGVCLAP